MTFELLKRNVPHSMRQDICDEAFVRYRLKCEKDQNKVRDHRHYVRRIIRNLAINYIRLQIQERKRAAAVAAIQNARSQSQDTPIISEYDRNRLSEAYAMLSEKEREVVRFHLLDGLSFEQIAQRRGSVKSTFSRRYNDAMSKMNQWFRDHEGE